MTGITSIKQEVTLKVYRNPIDKKPFIEQDMVSLNIVTRDEDTNWLLEFFPDFETELLWSELVHENQYDEVSYLVEVVRRGYKSTGLVTLKGFSNNPCKLQGIDSLSKWKKAI